MTKVLEKKNPKEKSRTLLHLSDFDILVKRRKIDTYLFIAAIIRSSNIIYTSAYLSSCLSVYLSVSLSYNTFHRTEKQKDLWLVLVCIQSYLFYVSVYENNVMIDRQKDRNKSKGRTTHMQQQHPSSITNQILHTHLCMIIKACVIRKCRSNAFVTLQVCLKNNSKYQYSQVTLCYIGWVERRFLGHNRFCYLRCIEKDMKLIIVAVNKATSEETVKHNQFAR